MSSVNATNDWSDSLNSITFLSTIMLFAYLQVISSLDPKNTIQCDLAWSFAKNGGKNVKDFVYIPSQNMLFYGVPGFYLSLLSASMTLLGSMTDSVFQKLNISTSIAYERYMVSIVIISGIIAIVSLVFFALTVQGLINSKFPMYPSRYCFAKDMAPVEEVQELLKNLSEKDNPMLEECIENGGDSFSDKHSLRSFLFYLICIIIFLVAFLINIFYYLSFWV